MAGRGEKRAADAAGEGQGLELRGDAAEGEADVVGGVQGAPFVRGGGFFAVEAFEAEVEVREGGREGVRQDGVDGLVGRGFGLGVGAVPFAQVGERDREVAEVGFGAHDVPGAFEDEGADVREDGEVGGGGLRGGGFPEVVDHGGFFAVAAFDCEDACFGEEALDAVEDLAYGGVV